jgi:hypothetical protein
MHEKNTGCHHDPSNNHVGWAKRDDKNRPCWHCNVCDSFNGWLDAEEAKTFIAKYFSVPKTKRAQLMRDTNPANVLPKQGKLF